MLGFFVTAAGVVWRRVGGSCVLVLAPLLGGLCFLAGMRMAPRVVCIFAVAEEIVAVGITAFSLGARGC